MTKPYLDAPVPHRLAHRGATMAGQFDENSWDAFRAALSLGASHLETDAQVTSDGHAVLVHDDDLVRVGATPLTGGRIRVAEYSLAELEAMRLAKGGAIPSLLATLLEFPDARFNIDVKRIGVAAPIADAVNATAAWDRVLITSFSDRRRKAALRLMKRPDVATSAGVSRLLLAFAAAGIAQLLPVIARRSLVRFALRGIDALQIPISEAGFRIDRPWFVRSVRDVGVHVHFWVINDRDEANRLLAMGASGIVSDDLERTL